MSNMQLHQTQTQMQQLPMRASVPDSPSLSLPSTWRTDLISLLWYMVDHRLVDLPLPPWLSLLPVSDPFTVSFRSFLSQLTFTLQEHKLRSEALMLTQHSWAIEKEETKLASLQRMYGWMEGEADRRQREERTQEQEAQLRREEAIKAQAEANIKAIPVRTPINQLSSFSSTLPLVPPASVSLLHPSHEVDPAVSTHPLRFRTKKKNHHHRVDSSSSSDHSVESDSYSDSSLSLDSYAESSDSLDLDSDGEGAKRATKRVNERNKTISDTTNTNQTTTTHTKPIEHTGTTGPLTPVTGVTLESTDLVDSPAAATDFIASPIVTPHPLAITTNEPPPHRSLSEVHVASSNGAIDERTNADAGAPATHPIATARPTLDASRQIDLSSPIAPAVSHSYRTPRASPSSLRKAARIESDAKNRAADLSALAYEDRMRSTPDAARVRSALLAKLMRTAIGTPNRIEPALLEELTTRSRQIKAKPSAELNQLIYKEFDADDDDDWIGAGNSSDDASDDTH